MELQYGNFFDKLHVFRNKDAFHLFTKAEVAYRTGVIGFLILNCHTCMNGSIVNSFYNTRAPSLEEYRPLDEDLIHYNL